MTGKDNLVAKFLAGWLALTLLLNLRYPAPLSHPAAALLPPPELILLSALLSAAAWFKVPVRQPVFTVVTIVLIGLWFFQLGESVMRAYLNRSFSLYTDAALLPDLLHLLYKTMPKPVFALILLGSALLVGMLFALIRFSLCAVYGFLQSGRHRRVFCGAGGLFLASCLALLPHLPADSPLRAASRWNAVRLLEEISFIARIDDHRERFQAQMQADRDAVPRFPGTLEQLQGNDVYLFFIESYGHTVFAHPRHRALMLPVFKQFEKDMTSQGFAIYSNFLNSPTYGGASWLAHATLASGYHLNNQFRYNLLITSDVKTAVHAFKKAGYRTVSVMPGITWPFPEALFFGYDIEYHARHFEYKGTPFGWSTMPDQYVLDFVYHREMAQRRQPLFIEFVLISSHAPFHEQPPYLPDWSQIGHGKIYAQKQKTTFPVTWPALEGAEKAYASALTYEFKILKDFLTHRIKDHALILIMGDHQPNLKITGPNQPWSVPVHVLSRNRQFMRPFAARGYTGGMIPEQVTPHTDMARVMTALFEDFSSSK